MINPAVFKAIGGLVEGQKSVSAEGLVDILLEQGFNLEDISDTIYWVFESENESFRRRVFSPWEQWVFPLPCQSLLIHLVDSGFFSAEAMESIIWRMLQDNDDPVSMNQLLAECMNEINDPMIKALLTPNIVRQ